MDRFKGNLEEKLEEVHGRLTTLSEQWQTHTNRRTILTFVFAGALSLTLYVSAIQPPEEFPINALIPVPEGATLSETADSLEAEGVVRSGLAFKILLQVLGKEESVHAGDYLFKKPEGLFTVARAISEGYYGLEPIRIRVPEGAMVKNMTKLFDRQLERFDAERFLTNATPQEGYLFPDTYFFMPNATDETVINVMRDNFDQHIADLKPPIASSTRSLSDIVIMASILEREAFNTTDRRMISGVLWNRLARGMALQVDVTFAYTESKGTFDLTLSDLTDKKDLYNTYVHKGLPPGPIGSPSMDAIEAALTPTKSTYLFFLADHEGVTHYCETFECQQANKEKYF